MKCENCKKGVMYGHNVSHSKRRTRRIFKPNLHVSRVIIEGISKRMKLCSKCLRLLKGKSTRDVKKNIEKNKSSEAPQIAVAV